MRVEIDPPVAHVAPLSRSQLSTAALDIVGLATAREAGPGSATSLPPTPVPVHGATARRTLPPVSHERRRSDSAFAGVSTAVWGTGHPSATTLDGPSLGPAEPTVIEDLWATPTSDLADLVAQVLAQLAGVRRSSSAAGRGCVPEPPATSAGG
jgi:hypothetical protein